MTDAKTELRGLSDYVFSRTRGRLKGLTDDEYFWEPVEGCWTVRKGADGKFAGDWAVWPMEDAPGQNFSGRSPFTTVAWRMAHLIYCYCGDRHMTLLADPGEPRPEQDLSSASAAIESLEAAHAWWQKVLEALPLEKYYEAMGPVAGIYADASRAAFAFHMVDEYIHHAAEIGVVRDLYRETKAAEGRSEFVAACLAGDAKRAGSMLAAEPALVEKAASDQPDLLVRTASLGWFKVVEVLAGAGFPLEPVNGVSALHHAAGNGNLDAVKNLIAAGADPTLKDPTYDADAKGWAEYFRQKDVVDYLATK